MMDDKGNVVAVGNLHRGARIECRIVERPADIRHDKDALGSNRYETVWLLIDGDKVVEVGHLEAFVLGMMED